MMKTSKSLVVSESGDLVKNMPSVNDLKSMSVSKQKKIIVESVIETQYQAAEAFTKQKKLKERAKELGEKIKLSREARELMEIKKEMSKQGKISEIYLAQRVGMQKLAEKLGIDVSKEIKNVRLIEGSNN